ncbi:MAG TPA: MFS transporter, partial [Archangium sp.]|nr:MFS transporter [Archangium sp.]
YAMTMLLNAAGFVIIPNISSYVQNNLGYPRDKLEAIYFVGGLVSFVTLRLAGKAVDRQGAFQVGTVGVGLFMATLYLAFIQLPTSVPLVAVFALFFLSNGVRNVAYSTLTSKVPESAIRARFMSFQSAVQHLGAAGGAFLSAQMLTDLPGGQLGGMGNVVALSMALSLTLPVMFFLVERRLRAREQAAGTPVAAVALGGGSSRS